MATHAHPSHPTRYPLAPTPPAVPSKHPQMDWVATRKALEAHAASHPGAWLIVCKATPARRAFRPAELASNPALNEIKVESFLRQLIPQKSESPEKRVRGWEVWMRVKADQSALYAEGNRVHAEIEEGS